MAGLLAGNANIVRVPTKEFKQINIICHAISKVLKDYDRLKPYITLIKYGHNYEINDYLSSVSDIRIIWGGDKTISELRKAKLAPRAKEITFADRYSIAVIDSDFYVGIDDKTKVAMDFYNDTYLTDQNACTSPRVVVWTGSKIDKAKVAFWSCLYDVVKKRYGFQDIMSVDKLSLAYEAMIKIEGLRIIPHDDNLIVRIEITKTSEHLMEYKGYSGYFYEYDCRDSMEIKKLCDNKQCQSVGILGDKDWMRSLIEAGIKGVDRVVKIGHTMDFSLIWDGYDLIREMSREIVL